MLGLQSILSLFRNEFDKFNNTVAQILDSFYHNIFGVKTPDFVIFYAALK